MVHELIKNYGLLSCMQIKPSKRATADDLLLFHSSSYVQQLIKHNADESSSSDSDSDVSIDDDAESYGLVYDCPKFRKLFDFAAEIAGGTLSAVDAIMSGANIAINWTGGWHHAQTDEAEGFCYVNDIAIGIKKLRERFKKILYIDLDIHHGNGVENAFSITKNVLTLSFHQSEVGFYPGTGRISNVGEGRGKGFAINAPFRRSIAGEKYVQYFKTVAEGVYKCFQPEVCVVQCGADILVGDPLGGANLGLDDMGECVKGILSWTVPKIFVGGGGYNFANTARYWVSGKYE
jgi:histone deacetylase 8